MLFSNKSTYPIGLDISDLSLKLVQLNKIGNKIKIQAMGKINLPHGLIDNGEIKNQEKVIKAIKKLIADPKYGKVSPGEVIACLPETKTFIKLIEVDKTPNPISEIIGNEIEKHVPMPINEIFYDWQIIEEHSDKQLILIGAVPQNIVNQYTALLDETKLSTVALEIEPISICRSLLNEESPKFKSRGENYGIIDIGAKRTSMIFYAKNTILFTVSMPTSGQDITNNIAKALDIKTKQAEKAKIICGLNKNKAQGIIKDILTDTVKELMKKIKEAIEFYNNNYSDQGPIKQILLCGGGANINNLDKIISQDIDITVKLSNPLINLTEAREKFSKILTEKHSLETNFIKTQKKHKAKEKTLPITQNAGLTFTTAIGLALRGMFIEEL
ncbi:MAG: type IV pilus assembly protein PilM [Patescibacteria group bacterium]|nr:type IV pilus assembly protein PilM [Patescibacteria group bacterium]